MEDSKGAWAVTWMSAKRIVDDPLTMPNRGVDTSCGYNRLVPFAILDNVRLYYEEEGTGSPVLLLHNYFGTVDVWKDQRRALGGRYRVVAVEARAHGRSSYPGGRLRMTDLAGDVAELVRSLNSAPVHVVGSSLGAQVGLHLAREDPNLVRTLTAVDPPHLDEPTTREYMENVIREVFPANERRMEAEHSGGRPGHARSVLLENFALDGEEVPRDQVAAVALAGGIRCPVLIVGGDDDPVFPLRRALELWGRIPDGEMLILPRAGHFPHRVAPGVFNEVLLDFLRRRS